MPPSLIYPGCGYDNQFLSVMSGYSSYTIYDSLPAQAHYEHGQPGYKFTKTKKCFFRKLRQTFGAYTKTKDGALLFAKHNLVYNYSRNAESIKNIPPGDVLCRGFIPHTWLNELKDPNRYIFVACDTNPCFLDDNEVKYRIVHFCGDGYCHYDDNSSDDESSDDESSDDESKNNSDNPLDQNMVFKNDPRILT